MLFTIPLKTNFKVKQMLQSEKQFNTKATTDTFDEIYTNFDVSVNETYTADQGYPFDYPTRWLNDPSMNKRIAIRRLDVTPSSHAFTITLMAEVDEDIKNDKGHSIGTVYPATNTIEITYQESLIKVLNHLCTQFSYDVNRKIGGIMYDFDDNTNKLDLYFKNSRNEFCDFKISSEFNEDINEFLKFLNQPIDEETIYTLTTNSYHKTFSEVWSRDRIHFHSSFSTSRRKFIGKRGDFYQSLTLLYPPPTNESTFYIRFTSNGMKNILIRYCEFDIQLCFIINYKKTVIL